MNDFIKFILRLSLFFFILFPLHAVIQNSLGYSYFEHYLLSCYLVNYTLVIGIFAVLYHYKEKLATSLGFLFMGGFLLKLVVFFLFFNPLFKADSQVQNGEFIAFFLPYSVGLILETISMVKILNKGN